MWEASSSADERVAGHYVIEPQEISEMVKPDKTVKILIVEDNPEMRKVLAQIFLNKYMMYIRLPTGRKDWSRLLHYNHR